MVRANNNATQKQHRCPICKQNHRLQFCRQLRRMEPEERLRAVLLCRHCANCLSSRHMASSCPSTRNCDRCRERHHSLLHLWETPRREEDVPLDLNVTDGRRRRQPRPYRARALTESSEEVLEIDVSDEDIQQVNEGSPDTIEPPILRPPLSGIRSAIQHPARSTKKRHRQSRQRRRNPQPRHRRGMRDARERIRGSVRRAQGSSVLIPTVLLRVMSRGRSQSVRAIVDPGQPESTIARALARRLHALPRCGSDHCTLTLKGWNERLEIRARVLPSLTRTAPERTVDARVAGEFDNLRLADPAFYRSSAISMVLGADAYAVSLRPGLMPATPTRPAAQNTIFGWVISGATPYGWS
ncbi:uncharacterized protein LOC118755887 [Rhagoletis pomonella]|uniref:uncharacterized protein LOC118755887 n=1 Tax=Rhagoletis pomonella TaxID=28610 RepID=UPI00177FBCA6|nr:uncharacterized protein LOC118755887 [Rhagoletis pomonella]